MNIPAALKWPKKYLSRSPITSPKANRRDSTTPSLCSVPDAGQDQEMYEDVISSYKAELDKLTKERAHWVAFQTAISEKNSAGDQLDPEEVIFTLSRQVSDLQSQLEQRNQEYLVLQEEFLRKVDRLSELEVKLTDVQDFSTELESTKAELASARVQCSTLQLVLSKVGRNLEAEQLDEQVKELMNNARGCVGPIPAEMETPTNYYGFTEDLSTYGFRRNSILRHYVSSHALSPANLEKMFKRLQEDSLSWTKYMESVNSKPKPSPTLKELIRYNSMPSRYRAAVWTCCMDAVTKPEEEIGSGGYIAEYQLQLSRAAKRRSTSLRNAETLSFLRRSETAAQLEEASDQVEIDLHRALPNNSHFMGPEFRYVGKLRNVLRAYIQRSAERGLAPYLQSMSRIAAVCLLVFAGDEAAAFRCLVVLLERILPPNYYSDMLELVRADLSVLEELVREKLPKVYAKLVDMDVPVTASNTSFFMTFGLDCLPIDTAFCVLDTLMYEKRKVLWRWCLAVFKNSEDSILKCKCGDEIFTAIHNAQCQATDSRGLAEIAFRLMNPLSLRHVNVKHGQHLKKLAANSADTPIQEETEVALHEQLLVQPTSHHVRYVKSEVISDTEEEELAAAVGS